MIDLFMWCVYDEQDLINPYWRDKYEKVFGFNRGVLFEWSVHGTD